MNVYPDPFKRTDLPRGGVLTIGNFDGVHLGHREMLRRVVGRARELDAPSAVLTFDPHPLKVLHPQRAPRMIQTFRQREEAIAELGVDALFVVPFTREFASMPAEEFVRDLLGRCLGAREVHVGTGFVFGCGKRGNVDLLSRLGKECGIRVVPLDVVSEGDEPVSSTRVRSLLEAGNVAEVRRLLGRPYAMEGIISKGDRMGRKIGFPTINLRSENELYPRDGVYVTKVLLRSFERTFTCVTNIGRRPTVYEDYATTVESYILDFSSDVYGEPIRLSFFERLRDEKVFPSMIELTAQIRRDVEATRLWFLSRGEG
ncbi:MAG: bifunctional riboflavin kinase/FAD synthetase [Thermoanaerobaculia bacterium]